MRAVRALSSSGCPRAALLHSALGEAFRDGEGGPRNECKAGEWYRKAADQDNQEALSLLATGTLRFVRSRGTGRWHEADKQRESGWVRGASNF